VWAEFGRFNCSNLGHTRELTVPIYVRTSLASESGWVRVPMSQTRPCVECHEPDFGRLSIYIYIRSWLPSQAPRGGLASQTRTCMGTFRLLRVRYILRQNLIVYHVKTKSPNRLHCASQNSSLVATARTRGVPSGVGGSTPTPRNSEVLTKLSRIHNSVENTRTSVTT
jgi:hypothetical protein